MESWETKRGHRQNIDIHQTNASSTSLSKSSVTEHGMETWIFCKSIHAEHNFPNSKGLKDSKGNVENLDDALWNRFRTCWKSYRCWFGHPNVAFYIFVGQLGKVIPTQEVPKSVSIVFGGGPEPRLIVLNGLTNHQTTIFERSIVFVTFLDLKTLVTPFGP